METQVLVQQLEEFGRDMDWLQKYYDNLTEKYPNEHVAVLDEKIVDHDKDLKRLMGRIEAKYPAKRDRVAIKFISLEKVELILWILIDSGASRTTILDNDAIMLGIDHDHLENKHSLFLNKKKDVVIISDENG